MLGSNAADFKLSVTNACIIKVVPGYVPVDPTFQVVDFGSPKKQQYYTILIFLTKQQKASLFGNIPALEPNFSSIYETNLYQTLLSYSEYLLAATYIERRLSFSSPKRGNILAVLQQEYITNKCEKCTGTGNG